MSIRTFLGLYQEKGYNIVWYALIDPPFHAITQGIVFLFLGSSQITAGITTELYILFGAFLLYFLSLKILNKKHLALSVVVLYLLSAIIIDIGGLSMLAIPLSLMMVGWYYFTFHKKGRTIIIKFSERIKPGFNTTVMIGALFLTAATLMKYHSLIYVSAFFVLYGIYLWIKNKRFPLHLLKIGLSQVIIVLSIGFWWMKFALFEHKLLERIFYLGIGRKALQPSFSYMASFFINTLKETTYIALFALIPIILWLFKRENSFVSKNPRLIIYILSIYIVATFVITTRHLRYAIHVIPFVFILTVRGIDDFAKFIKTRLKIKYVYVFIILMVLLIGISAFVSFNHMKKQVQNRGIYSYELVDYMSSVPNPKYLINIDANKGPEANYYHNPDLFIFETMMVNDRINVHNPKLMEQYSAYYPWNSIKQNYKQFVEELDKTSNQINVVVVLFKFDDVGYNMTDPMNEELLNKGFAKKELKWYYVYKKP